MIIEFTFFYLITFCVDKYFFVAIVVKKYKKPKFVISGHQGWHIRKSKRWTISLVKNHQNQKAL